MNADLSPEALAAYAEAERPLGPGMGIVLAIGLALTAAFAAAGLYGCFLIARSAWGA